MKTRTLVLVTIFLVPALLFSAREKRASTQTVAATKSSPTLNYATYLGRSINDKVNAIALGLDGSTYVAGIAPAIATGKMDEAFVAHISANGKELLYMAYLGGGGATDARGIAVDAAGNVYITGETKAADFPAQNALQGSCSLKYNFWGQVSQPAR
jgi:hypothetical protein